MKPRRPAEYVLIAVLLLAAILRVGWISRGDPVNDEVFYGFRAVGLMDFDEAAEQTTPWEWLDPDIPRWAHWSFHDHPPLVFWIEHLSIGIFGENNFAMRFPSAVFGVASVYLVYLIGRRLYSERLGLFAAVLVAVTVNHTYISRLGMQEAYVIFFLLTGLYCFVRALERPAWWYAVGAAVGFGFLAKYTTAVLAPILLTYLTLFRRDMFRRRELWFGVLIAAVIASPVFLYNAMLYRAVGHFDFQLSYIFGQSPDVWRVAPGKDIGTLGDRMAEFIPRLAKTNSWLFLLVAAMSVLGEMVHARRIGWKTALHRHALLIISSAWIALLILKIGPSYRFLTMLTPLTALVAALGLDAAAGFFVGRRWRRWGWTMLAVIAAFEIFYTANTVVAYYPVGPTHWFSSSQIRLENYNWGYNALGAYFRRELTGKMPAIVFDTRYQFLEDAQERSLQRARERAARPFPAMIVTYGNFDRGAKLWVLDRLHIYHGWPVVDLETYFRNLKEHGFDYHDRVGFKDIYFVVHAAIVPPPELAALVAGLPHDSIANPRGEEVFRIYKKQ